MSRAGAGQIDDWRAGLATQLEMLRDEVRQGHQAIIERLARIEATLDEPNNLKRKNSGGRPSKFAWRDFYIEALRLEYNDEIQSRHHLQQRNRAANPAVGRQAGLQVTDTPNNMVGLRALVSARNPGQTWDLRCEVRERLIAFLQAEYPHALPRQRTELLGINLELSGGQNRRLRSV